MIVNGPEEQNQQWDHDENNPGAVDELCRDKNAEHDERCECANRINDQRLLPICRSSYFISHKIRPVYLLVFRRNVRQWIIARWRYCPRRIFLPLRMNLRSFA